ASPKIVGKKLRIAPHCNVYEEKMIPKAHGSGVLTVVAINRVTRCKFTALGVSAGTLARITGMNTKVTAPIMNHQIFQVTWVALSRTAEMPTPKNSAMPRKAPHHPMAALTLAGGARRRTSAGADTVIRIKPIPSMARVVINQAAFMAKPPTTEAMPANSIPSTRVYVAPIRSDTTEAANPPKAPASWTIPTRVPAATKLMWRSCRINSSAEGNFHTCIAAIMPVATTTVHARVPDPVVAITTKHTLGGEKSTRLHIVSTREI